MNAFFFWLFSAGMIVCALSVILNRNAVASALCFTFSIAFMAGLFVMLSAFFLAAIQILVTAGAVMVLFLFIIMLLDVSAMENAPRHRIWLGFSMVLALAFLILVAKTLAGTKEGFVEQGSLPVMGGLRAAYTLRGDNGGAGGANDYAQVTATYMGTDKASSRDLDMQDDTHQIGRLLFATNTKPDEPSYVAPFEITSLLILVATIGVIVLCKRNDEPRPRRHEEIIREVPPVEIEPASKF